MNQEKLIEKFGQKIDRLNRPIHVGDIVTFCKGGNKSSAIMGVATVVKWSAEQVQVQEIDFKTLKSTSEYTRSVPMHKLLVITDQIDANKQNFPELFI
ncbi:hypothetical protein [Vibrio phage phiKT1024]|nr:hypothetical protein [Vibrio phage phiKT1024]